MFSLLGSQGFRLKASSGQRRRDVWKLFMQHTLYAARKRASFFFLPRESAGFQSFSRRRRLIYHKKMDPPEWLRKVIPTGRVRKYRGSPRLKQRCSQQRGFLLSFATFKSLSQHYAAGVSACKPALFDSSFTFVVSQSPTRLRPASARTHAHTR